METSFENCENITIKNTGEKLETYYDKHLRLVNGLQVRAISTADQIFCDLMNLPPTPSQFANHEMVLGSATDIFSKASMRKVVEECVSLSDGDKDLCVGC